MHESMPWGQRRSDRLGHHANQILIATIIAVVATGLHPFPPQFALPIAAVEISVVLLAWLLLRQHDRRLCEHCALAMPLNPAERATRYRRRFWMAHTATEARFLIPYLVVLISSNFVTSPAGRVGWAIVQLSMIYLIMSHGTHRRLQPWCPWCRGGDTEISDTPPVLPQDDRQLT